MSYFGFTIETVGFKRAASILSQMGIAAEDAIPFWEEEVIPDMERIEYQMFKSQGRRGGGSWKFLLPETIEAKVRKGQSPLINVATGALLTSVSEGYGFEAKPEYAVRDVTPLYVKFGTFAPGAAQSQKFRPFLRFTKFDRARWARWFVVYCICRAKEQSTVRASDG